MPLPKADELFQLLLAEKDKEKSAHLLGELLEEHVIPLIKPILRSGLQKGNDSSEKVLTEVDDVSGEIIVSFIKRFENGHKEPPQIDNIEAYFTTVAKLRISDYWRRQNRSWQSLKNKIRYLFDNDQNLFFEKETHLCGFSKRESKTAVMSADAVLKILKQNNLINPQTDLDEAVKIILTETQSRLKINDLVNIFFEIQYLEDDMSDYPLEENLLLIANSAIGNDEQARLEARADLQRIWKEIKQLEFNQRTSLLLHIKEKGVSGVHLMLFLRVTNLQELAEILKMSLNDFAKLYPGLPLTDNEIAEILVVTPKQAANLRKVAREKLQRRLKVF